MTVPTRRGSQRSSDHRCGCPQFAQLKMPAQPDSQGMWAPVIADFACPGTALRGQGPPPFRVESPPIMSLCIIESLPMCCSIQLAMSSHQPGEEVVETEARESVPIH